MGSGQEPVSVMGRFIDRVRESGYRGLIVATGVSTAVAGRLVGLVCDRYDKVLGVGIDGGCLERVEPRGLERVLGRTFDSVVVDTDYAGVDANTIAGTAETIRGGGVLVLVTRSPWREWKPLGPRAFYKYFKSRVLEARQVLCIDLQEGRVQVERVVESKAPRPVKPRGTGLPRWLEEHVATSDQARGLRELIRLLSEEKAATVLVTGNRGRGKTSLIGLLLAYLVASRSIGVATVTAPTPLSVQPLFTILARVLARRGIRYKAWGPRPVYHGVKGGWFKVQYEHPSAAGSTPLVVVDEAAAVGVARTRRIAHRSRKTLITTTVHGYEGSGKAFLHRLLGALPNPHVIELREPIRYPSGDPLEDWVYNTFMLNADPDPGVEAQDTIDTVSIEKTSGRVLAEDPGRLRTVYSILVTAHYRNTPNDLVALLEHEFDVYMAVVGSVVAGVAQVRVDDKMLRDILASQYNASLHGSIARIVRIAVHPSLQRRGVGSRLLKHVEEDVERRGVCCLGAVFSNHDVIGFWLKNGYTVIYISPRFNKVTGEKNVAVVKPLTLESEKLLDAIVREFGQRLVLAGSSVYRDLPAEEIAQILTSQGSCPRRRKEVAVTRGQLHRLKLFFEGHLYHEAVQDVLLLLVARAASNCCMNILSQAEATVLSASIVQGKPTWDVARIAGVEGDRLEEAIREAVKRLVEACVPVREEAEGPQPPSHVAV